MTFLKSIKTFVMSVFWSVAELRQRQAMRITKNARLEHYIQSKGCQDISCVEHWIKEFEKDEKRRYSY